MLQPLGSLAARTCMWLSLVVACASPELETEGLHPTVVNRTMPSPLPLPAVPGKGGTATRSGDPSWRPGPDLPLPMSYHASILVPTGRVLITGGDVFGAGLWAEYDPLGGEIVTTGAMHQARERATATLLNDGRVLVAGGRAGEIPSETAEIYDPVSRTWAETGPMREARWRHTATLLPSGEVLVVAGAGSEGKRLTSAELYDPNAGTFSFTDEVDEPLIGHAATALHSGDVLITGGMAAGTQALVFRQETRRFELAGELSQARKGSPASNNWVVDAWMWAYPHADMALQNSGGVKIAIQPGPITVGMLVSGLPHPNYILEATMTGAQVVASLEGMIAKGTDGPVAGIRYESSSSGLLITMEDGTPLDTEATYTVLINDYMHAGQAGFPYDPELPVVPTGAHMRDPVIAWTEQLGTSASDPLDNYLDPLPRGQ